MIIHPAFIMIIGALLLPLFRPRLRPIIVAIIPAFSIAAIWNIHPSMEYFIKIAGFNLNLFHIHDYSKIFATAFGLAAFAGGLFAIPQMKKDGAREVAAAFIYAGSAIGATFAGDLITLFIFWEIMLIASTIVVACGRSAAAIKAATRYAYMHLFGGVILLAGIILHIWGGGNSTIGHLDITSNNIYNIPAILMLIGVLVNAAAPPFSAWLADAYPNATPSGTVFLSAFTTKTAVFVLLTIFAGTEILIYIGLFMVFYGIIYAMLENDIRRILSYSIVNQVGFMVTGIGIGTKLALYGVATHAFCHIIYKAVMLMSAGSVIYRTGKNRCSDVGGIWHSMKFTAICGIIGAMAISAFPFTSGFVSKSLVSSAAAHEHLAFVWFLLAAASAGVFLHAGIKFPWFVFFQKDSGLRPKEPPISMRIAMLLLAIMCILPGLFPQYLYAMLPDIVEYEPYTNEHVVTQLQLLLFAGFAFFAFLPILKRTETISLDFDWIYRVPLRNFILFLGNIIDIIASRFLNICNNLISSITNIIYSNYGTSNAIFARSWSLRSTVTLAGMMLGIFLILYYFM